METNFINILSYLLYSINQTHIFHLQINSYAKHKALQEYYEGMRDLLDNFIEFYQGKFSIIKDYTNFIFENYENDEKLILYYEDIRFKIENLREYFIDLGDFGLVNKIDEILDLINITIYKLKNLK